MMSRWSLPKTLNVGGTEYHIRYQFGAVLDVLTAYSDTALEEDEKAEIMLRVIFPNYADIPQEHISEAIAKACEFIDCGSKSDGKPKPKVMDWNQDAELIIPAINSVAGVEVRENPDMHWWTFWGYFMAIGDSLFSNVIHIRKKKASGKKLEKWEEEFYRDNKSMIDLKSPESEEIKAEKENILKWL